ncbi:MAG: efflux RND transporter periplasmic adaptor subunit [Limnohabitans sp.]|nr:efflux RND transporter periplasmic adaptor subunit [Limnohabitans sp.]
MSWGFALLTRIQSIDLTNIKSFVIKHKWRILIILVLIYAGTKAYDHFFPTEVKRGGVQTVTTLALEKKDVPLVIESTGTIAAANIVDIRPMITNMVKEIHIKEGQDVKKGQLLFTLDDRNDRANYDRAKALADDAQRQLQRAKELVAKNFISKAGLDTAEANAKSTMATARAAEVQLSFDSIRSPIDGRAGIINVFPGSLVQASNVVVSSTTSTATSTTGAMVTITQIDPINVQFIVAENNIPLLMQNDIANLKVSVTVGNNLTQIYEGKVIVVDNQVDPAIGAVRVKAQIPNQKRTLLPGQFARIKLEANTLKDAIVIPSQAVVINPRGRFVYIVGQDDKVNLRPIKVTYEYQGNAAITGVEVGERIVLEGKQNLRPGVKIREAKVTPPAKPAIAESKPTDVKPSEAKPSESKPTEKK